MKRLDGFLLRSFLGPLILTFFISEFILLMQFLWKYVDELVGKGLDMITIGKFMFYASWTFVPMALPLAVLLASLMTFGNLGERYELVAVKSAGVPLRRTMLPLAIIALLVSGIAYLFSNHIAPQAYLNYTKIYYEIRTKKPTLNIREGEYYSNLEGYVIRVDEKQDGGSRLKNIQIYDHTDREGNLRMTIAKTGSMFTTADSKYLVFNLEDGYTYTEDEGDQQSRQASYPFTKIQFKRQRLVFDLASFNMSTADKTLFERKAKALPLSLLNGQIDTLKQSLENRLTDVCSVISGRSHYMDTYIKGDSVLSNPPENVKFALDKDEEYILSSASNTAGAMAEDMDYYKRDIAYWKEQLASYQVEWHKKFTLSIACFLLFFIGAPLGSIIRKGGMGMPVVASVILFIAYHIINMIGEKAALKGELGILEGMWIAPLIFLPFGIFLTIKANSDSPLLNKDGWIRFLKRK